MNTGGIIGTLIIVLVILVVIFLIFREVICWYWKINQQLALLTEIRDFLASSKTGTASVLPAATSQAPGGPAPPTPTQLARNAAAINRLAQRIRDDPRLPIDEKIELLQRLGGSFFWDKSSSCRVSYNGQELTFPGGKEFGEWLTATVLPEALRRTADA